jgi:hypothetical protein
VLQLIFFSIDQQSCPGFFTHFKVFIHCQNFQVIQNESTILTTSATLSVNFDEDQSFYHSIE